MIDLSSIKHHPVIEELGQVICNKTQNSDRGFYDVVVAYMLGKMASTMRVNLLTKDRGEVPVNIYALALGTSGMGKGYSVTILEKEIAKGFTSRFLNETFPIIADANLFQIAQDRAIRDGTDEKTEKAALDKEFREAGAYAFTFDSGTAPAVKQFRHKLLLANAGAISLQVDEIGSNIEGVTELLNLFLELYDQGLAKQKLTKNTKENVRAEEMEGKTPTNLLMFGTPAKLLDGGRTEDQFYSFLETGYARRLLFGMGTQNRVGTDLTPAEVFQRLTDSSNNALVQKWHDIFSDLADPDRFGWTVVVPDPVAIELIAYKMQCEAIAAKLPENEEILKSEISHRYYKCLKLAGAYAFVDGAQTLTMMHLHMAMKLVEQSGESFKGILRREKTYAKLARYLAGTGTEQTHADLHEALPFYKSGVAARNELMSMAMAWGYKNHIIVRKNFSDGIEFFTGESLEETDMKKLQLSYSNHIAFHYKNGFTSFDNIEKMVRLPDHHWATHHFKGGHRSEENAQAGFNLITLDVDEGNSLAMVHELLSDYAFMTYTTKRHQMLDPETGIQHGDRFRLIIPMNYKLLMDSEEYKEFLENVTNWLPFAVDRQANQRSRKWLTNPNAIVHKNEGKLMDVLKFIPKTSKNEEYVKSYQALANLDNLERWFAERMSTGNRNNNLLNYALALVDNGTPYHEIEGRVLNLNRQISNPLTEDEIRNTILLTAAKKSVGTP